MSKPAIKQYAYWNEGDGSEGGFWMLYDTLRDAVKEGLDEYEEPGIFVLTAKSLGRYVLKDRVSKVRTKK